MDVSTLRIYWRSHWISDHHPNRNHPKTLTGPNCRTRITRFEQLPNRSFKRESNSQSRNRRSRTSSELCTSFTQTVSGNMGLFMANTMGRAIGSTSETTSPTFRTCTQITPTYVRCYYTQGTKGQGQRQGTTSSWTTAQWWRKKGRHTKCIRGTGTFDDQPCSRTTRQPGSWPYPVR